MGIADLYKVILDECPDVLVVVPLSDLTGMRIAVDISIFLNRYVKTLGDKRWIEGFIIFLCCLKRHGIKPVCIFDGPNPPPEKKREQERRRAESAKIAEKINHGKKILKKLETEYLPEELAPDEDLISEIMSVMGTRSKNVKNMNFEDIYDVIQGLKASLAKREVQNLPILPKYGQIAKKIIDIMGFSSFQAEGEAETLCSALCCAGMVDGVLSEDTDVLAYGTPFLLSKIDIQTEKVTMISHDAICEYLKFTQSEFRDLCILLSCDYNERGKGYPPDGKKEKSLLQLEPKVLF